MAINPSNRHGPNHMSITCATGGGKGIAVTSLGLFPDDSCMAIFDPYGEYSTKFGKRRCYSYKTRQGFAKAFYGAWKTGKPFCVSYNPTTNDKIKEVDWFSELMWAASDGNRVLHLLYEEFGRCTESVAKCETKAGEIATGSRKYGIRAGFVFQRPAQVPKEIWGNTRIKVIGAQEEKNDAKRIMNQLDCSLDDVMSIGKLNDVFEMNYPNSDDKVKTKVHYLYGKGLGNFEKVAAIVEPNRKLTKNWSENQKQQHQNSPFRCIN